MTGKDEISAPSLSTAEELQQANVTTYTSPKVCRVVLNKELCTFASIKIFNASVLM